MLRKHYVIKHLILLKIRNMIYKCFDKKTSGGTVYISNKELAEEVHKPVIRKFNKGKVHSLL